MKCKRILSMLLTLCMVMSLFAGTTVTASAAGGATTLYVNGVNMLSESSTAPDGVSYDKSTNTLTLTDAELSTPYSGTDDNSNKLTAIIYSKQGLTINLVGNSTITYSDSTDEKMLMGIMNTYGDLKFTGDGSLTIKNAVESGGTDKLCYGIDAYGTLTVDGPTITIDAGKTDTLTCQAEYGVLLIGTFAIESGTVTIRTRNTTGSNTALYTINGKNKNNTLGSGAKLIAEAGSRSNASTNSYGIVTESSLQLGAGASLRASGGEKALNIGSGGTIKAASADLTLSATGSTTHKAATKELQTISSDSDTLTSLQYKTIEVTAAGGSTAQYATAELKLNGYTAGAALNQATITTTSSTGFTSIDLDGFMTKADLKPDTIGDFAQTQTYYVSIKMPRSAGYELQESDGKPVGVTLEGATPEPFPYNRDFLIFKMNSRPAAAASSPFTDGFGNSIDNASTYVKGTTTNDKGYTFAGWFDGDGDELDSADNAQTGETYTAKWTKNGKTVRATALDLRDATANQNSTDEGWSWNAATKTLTLSGCTIDVPRDASFAVGLPDGAKLTTAADTQNTLSNSSTDLSVALYGTGEVTINGSGSISFIGYQAGLSAGEIMINAPITAIATNEQGGMAVHGGNITINSALRIMEPSGGKIVVGKGYYIADSSENAAVRVVIGTAAPTFDDGLGNADCAFDTYEKGATNEKGYTFAGWFNGKGEELTSASTAQGGTTYTAKWTKNGKTVRTTALDLRDATANQNSTDEGWSWDAGSKTLTFSGATIDIPESNTSAIIAVCLPEGATVKSDANTQNTICNRSEAVESVIGLMGMGALTIDGSGELSITGKVGGILSMGALTINAPLAATITGERGMAVSASKTITLDSSVSIKTPTGGKVCTDKGAFIGDSNGTHAKEVVIGAAAAAPTSTFKDGFGNSIADASTYVKGTTTNDKGYTFAGWFDGDGDELTSADNAQTGEIYTAKWTKNGKTVRTTALDLTKISQDNTFGAALQGSVYTNSAEGWTWDSDKNILTLANVTMDITLSEGTTDTAAVRLPDGAILATAPGTDNNVTVNNNNAGAIVGAGTLTIPAAETGKLTVVGGMSGICAKDIIINIPISVSAKDVAVYTEDKGTITIASGLEIKSPIGGKIVASQDASAIYEENGTTPAKNVVIGIAKKYTVTYNTNGGSAVESATVSEGNKLTAPQAPTKNGYTFHCWYKDAAFTNSWNFDTDTVTGNTTLYAKWTETTKIYGISGTVHESNGTTPASGVSVKLMKGDTQVASTTSATDGTYSFTGIAPGVYNIVAEKDDTTQTTLVIITNQSETGKDITMPDGKVNSKLTVNGADTPDVVAGGLDKEAAAVKNDNSGATSVKVEMTVESKSSAEVNTADKTNIETVASGKTLEYLDIKVTKTVDGSASAITTTANMMEIIIPYDMTGKSNITVYRNHSGSATAFTRLSTLPGSGAVDGTYYLDTANHLIYVYTKNFSTYAIGYNTQSGGGSGSGGSSSGGGSSSSSGGSSSGSGSSISAPSAKNGTVSVSPKSASKGTTVTVTVTPDKGYVLETLTVTDASGKKLDLKNLGSGKYSFTMPASKVEVKATFMEDNTMLNYFVDVPASAYYYDAVLWAAEQGITGGTDATHFSPDGVCTRAQAVTFLWRAAGSPAPSATAMPFTDVAADSYYYNAVLWAMENGITVGTSSTTFSPNLNCSRAQIVTFLWRSEKSPAAGSANPFTDVSADAYYADAVLWAVKESVTSGTSPATFSPDADCTRAQIVTFIWRTLAR